MQTVQFAPHCGAIIEASKKRPTISDNLDTVQYQCALHQNITRTTAVQRNDAGNDEERIDLKNNQHQRQSLSLDDAMIDSAFIVWDLRTDRCKEVVATISCTWFDEIHCYSDRDQISFPYVFVKMGLQHVPTITTSLSSPSSNKKTGRTNETAGNISADVITPETHHRLFAHYSTPTQPIVHITKSSCHWYFNNLNDCDFTRNDPPQNSSSRKILRPFRNR
jgi:hypothetical protein